MYSNNINYPYHSNYSSYKTTNYIPQSNDRFVAGGAIAPFILGGITGGLLAPAFYPRPYPIMPPPPPPVVYSYPPSYNLYIR